MNLADRMKMYEDAEAGRRLLPRLPILARLDGKAFHTWTRGLARPFDDGLVAAMRYTTARLLEETHALIAYTQSDEISLVWYAENDESQVWFDGRVSKMTSVLASMATAFFNSGGTELVPSKRGQLAFFDCRVWAVPSKEEAVNALLWREQDAVRNSVLMLAQSHFSHREMHNKNQAALHEMLHAKGINWAHLPPHLKRGSYFRRVVVERCVTAEEMARIPGPHQPPAGTLVKRHQTAELPDGLIETRNRVQVVFDGAVATVANVNVPEAVLLEKAPVAPEPMHLPTSEVLRDE